MIEFPLWSSDETLFCEKVRDCEEHRKIVNTFKAANENGDGVVDYLKGHAIADTVRGESTTYLVFDKYRQLCGFFTLKTCLLVFYNRDEDTREISKDSDGIEIKISESAIELVNFARNADFVDYDDISNLIAPIMMADFIVPIINEIRKYVGVQNIVIYAIDDRLVKYYQDTYGFGFLEKEATDYVCENIKPYYDHGGQLMILRLPDNEG